MEEMQKQTENVPLDATETADVADKEKPAFCNKFATADELEKAYDNLQREFTKKCQQNAQLSRALETARAESACHATPCETEPPSSRPDGQNTELPTENDSDAARTPLYESPDWDNTVEQFMSKYPSAARYAKDIAKTLASNAELSLRKDCLEKAYFDVLQKADRPYEELVGDEEFLERYVYGNDRVRDRIIEDFLRRNMDVQAPRTIAASGRTHVTPPSRPRSIREAGGIVKNMLANRRI